MRMIDGFARPGRQRESAGDQLAVGGVDGIEDGLFQRIGIDKSGEGVAVGSDGDVAMSRVGERRLDGRRALGLRIAMRKNG